MPHVGGMEAVVFKQARSLVEKGHEVTVITCRPDDTSPLTESRDGFNIRRIRALNFIEKKFGVTYPLISPFYFFKLVREINNYDVIHLHDVFYMTAHIAALAAWLKGRKYFLTQHVAMVDHPSKLVMATQRIVYKIFGDVIFKKAEKIVCYNINVKNFLLSRGVKEEKILQNYNGIDTKFYSPIDQKTKNKLKKQYGLDDKKPVVLFVGRLVPKKGYDIVAQAVDKKYTTLIVGGGDGSTKYRKYPNLKYFGNANESQLRDLYRMSDVFTFPAIGEMLTLVQQEAMACGIPQITAKNSGYDSYRLDDNLIKFVDRNVSDLKKHINDILSKPILSKKMSDYSRKIAIERFDWVKNYHVEYSIYNIGKLV